MVEGAGAAATDNPARAMTDNRTTPLNDALANENIEEAASLIKAGADVNKKDRDGSAPLSIAVVGWQNVRMVALLLGNGADPEIEFEGRSMLDWSINDKDEKIELLLREAIHRKTKAANHARAVSRQQWLRERARRRPKLRIAP